MSVKPLSGRLIVRPDKAPDRIGRIHIPQTAKLDKDAPGETGTVLHVAEDETTVKPGMKVLYPAYRGYFVTIDGEEVLGLKREDLWAVLS